MKIRAIVDELDRVEVKAPREGLDMLCVEDLGNWGRSTSVLTEQFLTSQTDEMTVALSVGKPGDVWAASRLRRS